MMKNINEETKQSSLIHQRISKAQFVPTEEVENKKFKYLKNIFNSRKIRDKFISIKRKINSVLQKVTFLAKKVDWTKIFTDSSVWMTEVFVEGLTINFATHYLFGIKFNIATIFAHGILIKQGINIFWRLKNNGSTSTIPKK